MITRERPALSRIASSRSPSWARRPSRSCFLAMARPMAPSPWQGLRAPGGAAPLTIAISAQKGPALTQRTPLVRFSRLAAGGLVATGSRPDGFAKGTAGQPGYDGFGLHNHAPWPTAAARPLRRHLRPRMAAHTTAPEADGAIAERAVRAALGGGRCRRRNFRGYAEHRGASAGASRAGFGRRYNRQAGIGGWRCPTRGSRAADPIRRGDVSGE
jgi:hypothetical protein